MHGRVLDATGAPVPNAQVLVRLERRGAPSTLISADGWGAFSLRLPEGRYKLTIRADGFVEASRLLTVGTGPAAALDFVLLVAGFTEAVTVDATAGRATSIVSATKTVTPLRDVAQSISIVTSAQIADQRMTSMADVVRYMPGVGMAQGEGNRDTPVLRGNSSTSNFFVDGVRDDVEYFRDVYNLERVEALKGPNALVFGRGGAGGVINRVTRQAEWGAPREVSVQLGSFGNRRVTGDVGHGLGNRMAARVTGMYENSDSYRAGVSVERYGFQPSMAYRLGPSTILRASYERFHDERTADRGIPSFAGRPLETEAGTFFGDPRNSPTRATVDLLASVVDHRFSDRLTLRTRTSYGLYDKFYQNVFPGAVNAAGDMVSISAYNNATERRNLFNQTDLIARPRTGRIAHTLVVGAELGRQITDNIRATGYFTSVGPSVTSVPVRVDAPTISLPLAFRQSATDADNHGVADIAGVYVQDQAELTSFLQAVAGVRLDLFNVAFTNNRTGALVSSRDRLVSPRLGLIYKPAVPVSIYLSYSLTHVPRAGDQLSSLSITNRTLDPERFRNSEVGLKWALRPTFDVTAALYRLDRGNVAVPDPVDPARALLVDGQRSRGLELEVRGMLTDAWSLVAGYAYQDGTITQSLSPTARAGAALAQLPAHSTSLWSKYAVTPRWSAAVGLVSRSEMFAATDNLVRLPGFTRVDAALFVDITAGLRAQLNVENLLDTRYVANAHSNTNISPGSPRAARVSLTTRF